MRKTTRRKTKQKKDKYCALLDKPCLGEECAIHFDKFDRCSLELIPYNLYPMTVAMEEVVEINHDLMTAVNNLTIQLKKLSGQKQLFT